jgi:hypothetical protein
MHPMHSQRSGLCLCGPYTIDGAKNQRCVPLAMVIYGLLSCVRKRECNP